MFCEHSTTHLFQRADMKQLSFHDLPPRPNELVVLSWAGGWGKALLESVSRPFEAWSGISVRHAINIGLRLPSNLTESLEHRLRPPVDVVWCNSVPALRMAQKGYCSPLSEETVPNLTELASRAKPQGVSGWPIVSPYIVHYVMAYRNAAFPNKPDSWEVLLEPRFRGKVALYPGGNGFYPIAQVLGGGSIEEIPVEMTPCWNYCRKLKPQVGRLDYSIGMGELIRRQELDICFRALPNAIAFKNEGVDVSWAAPREGVTDTTDALWIPRNVPENVAYWSQQYINFALSREIQEIWCGMLGVVPLHPGAALPAALRAEPALAKSPDDLSGVLYVPEIIKMRHELDWETRFDQIFS
jgi:putative spermidine/putrescine transport system substrate-binding protein